MLASLAACGETETPKTDETKPSESVPAVTETEPGTTAQEARNAIADEIEDEDFGGRDFVILGTDDSGYEQFVYTEETNGEGLNDSVYSRNLAIDERFNTKIRYYAPGDFNKANTTVKLAVRSSDTEAFQLASYHVVANGSNAIGGYYLNWYDIPDVNFEKPWWSDSNIDDLTVNGRCYLAIGDAAVSSIAETYCMIFDKDLAVNYQLEDTYSLVRSGQWTIDKLQSISADIYEDSDGNGIQDLNGFHGFLSNPLSNLNTYLWAFDNQIFRKDANGELQYTYYSERLVEIYQKLYSVFYESRGIGLTSAEPDGKDYESRHSYAIEAFADGKCLFVNVQMSKIISHLADFDHVYGILPYPKFNTEQEEYMTNVDDCHEAMAVAKNGNDLNFVGKITEVLCAESYKQILPAYYDVALKHRYASSPDDAEMIELCVESRVFDFGYVYDDWAGVSFYMQTLIGHDASADIASYYKKNESAARKHYEAALEVFYEEEE